MSQSDDSPERGSEIPISVIASMLVILITLTATPKPTLQAVQMY
jgi:hypothetical protein